MYSASNKPYNSTMFFLIFVSIFGLAMSILLVVYPPKFEDGFAFRNLAVGSAFGAVCVLGILAVIYPDSCSGILNFRKRGRYEHSSSRAHGSALNGHHPTCEGYSTHVLRIGGRRYCATCSGLLVGAIIVLVGNGMHFFGNLRVGGDPFMMVLMGEIAVIFGLFYITVPRFRKGFTRFFASIFFVTGSFLILVSIDEVAKNTSFDLFFVALSILWILTKIALSQWDHHRTCFRCPSESCRLEKKRVH